MKLLVKMMLERVIEKTYNTTYLGCIINKVVL